jgi:hypothetical protein
MKYLKTFKFVSEQLIYTSNMDEYADELKNCKFKPGDYITNPNNPKTVIYKVVEIDTDCSLYGLAELPLLKNKYDFEQITWTTTGKSYIKISEEELDFYNKTTKYNI